MRVLIPTAAALTGLALLAAPATAAPAPSAAPPPQPVKLVFIHHSVGENWLTDDQGGLGRALGASNYFVSDTNYGWGPNSIGDRTDIPNWLEWFRSPQTPQYMSAVYALSGQNSWYTRTLPNPGGPNRIVMFKSCFPNSSLYGRPGDPPRVGTELTVGNAKYVYNELLRYFAEHQDKLFIVVTAPPNSDASTAANARAFNQWLYNDWLRSNGYPYRNVAVFDFYNVLTGPNNHHRMVNGQVQHVFTPGTNTAYYPSSPGDDHPSPAGSRKATREFMSLVNTFYRTWRSGVPPLRSRTVQLRSTGSRDGWVLESGSGSGRGGRASTAADLLVGDTGDGRQYRSVLSFDTGTIPDNAWIQSVTLRLRQGAVTGQDPFGTHGPLQVDIRRPFFGTANTLAAADFQAPASRPAVGRVGRTPTSGWLSAALGSNALQWLSTTSPTQLRLRFATPTDADGRVDTRAFRSGNTAEQNRPVLVVRYLVP